VLEVPGIGPEDDLLELGADSLLALRALARLSADFGVELPLQEVFAKPTVASIANALRRACADGRQPDPGSGLVTLERGGEEVPLFLVHPAGGTAICYQDLARGLRRSRPVYGIEALGVAGQEPPLKTIEAMAARYVDLVLGAQPDGPYLLAGASMGGTVAFEMAQQLHRSGRKVGLLALLDTPGPGQMPEPMTDDAAIVSYLSEGTDLGLDGFQVRRLLEVFKANSRAMWDYDPAPYPGPILYLRARERGAPHPSNPELPWAERALGGIQVYDVPGDHRTMLRAPHAAVLAERLQKHLRSMPSIEHTGVAGR
jgi:thioesterase domain-containing protein/acyl carrier protein